MNYSLPQPLLQQAALGDLLLKNRSVMAPMTRTRADNSEHLANDLMREYYAQRASAGLIISEGTRVSEEAICQMNVPGLYTIQQAEAWKKVTDGVHEQGGSIFAQLWHGGSVSHPDYQKGGQAPIAPSAVNPLLEVNTPEKGKREQSRHAR
jgi:N-ethylmaleimide reductase